MYAPSLLVTTFQIEDQTTVATSIRVLNAELTCPICLGILHDTMIVMEVRVKFHLWVLRNKLFPGVFCQCFSAYTGFVAVAFRSVCESAEKNAHLVGFMSLLGDL